VQAIVVVVAVIIVVLNILTDVLYKLVDPRIELA
jgi:ABC-type dipeptide/oligopeptide/nickel transport system permease component